MNGKKIKGQVWIPRLALYFPVPRRHLAKCTLITPDVCSCDVADSAQGTRC